MLPCIARLLLPLALGSPLGALSLLGDPSGSSTIASPAVIAFLDHEGCASEAFEFQIGAKTIAGHLCQGSPDARFLAWIRDYGPFLQLLPVEELERLSIRPDRVDLEFRGTHERLVVLSEHRDPALAPRHRSRPMEGGRVYESKSEAVTLRVARTLRFLRAPDGTITGMRKGDLEVKCGFWLDLELETMRAPGRMAIDADGGILLVTGPDGQPLRDKNGCYVPQVFDCWVIVRVSGMFVRREVVIGVPRETPLATQGAAQEV